ncbi:MAG: hypothetical protein ACI4PQ_08505 [Butyricicoccaceae bacterium]
MKLIVRRPHHIPIPLFLPNGLLCGRFAAFVLSQALQQNGISIDSRQLHAILRSLPLSAYRGLRVVEIRTADGVMVQLTL